LNKYRVILAVDNWDTALDIHSRHHPRTQHLNLKLGDAKSREVLLDNLPKLKANDTLHIHASPPCQNLSSVNQKRNESVGLKLTWWTLKLLCELGEADSRITWSIEQVANKNVVSGLKKFDCHYLVIDMSEYGVCQSRKRLLISNVDLRQCLPDVITPKLNQVVTVPQNTCYIANSNYAPWKLEQKSSFMTIKDYEPKRTIGYTVVSKPAWFLDKNKLPIRKFSFDDCLALQTFPPGFFQDTSLSLQDKMQMVANSVPPIFSYVLSCAIDKHNKK
jgi:site-specific DNA-cytosine methylase